MFHNSKDFYMQKSTNKKIKKSSYKKIIIAIIFIFNIAFFAIGAGVYSFYCNSRMDTPENLKPEISKYNNLSCHNYSISSDEGLKLAGYLYSNTREQNSNPKGLVVVSHGLGLGGHIGYIDVIDVIVSNGYSVFAYDATGCDNSDGNGIKSFTQGLKDLDKVLSFIKTRKELNDMPILLWGHSWGAFNSCAVVKTHPEVIGIAALSGYNNTMQPLASSGIIGKIFSPYVTLFNRFISGDGATVTASEGLSSSKAKVFIAYGSNDTFIKPDVGYDVLYERFKDDARFEFVYLENRKHMNIYNDDKVATYRAKFEKGMDMSSYSKVDKTMWYGADSDLMNQIVEFYDSCVRDCKSEKGKD